MAATGWSSGHSASGVSRTLSSRSTIRATGAEQATSPSARLARRAPPKRWVASPIARQRATIASPSAGVSSGWNAGASR